MSVSLRQGGVGSCWCCLGAGVPAVRAARVAFKPQQGRRQMTVVAAADGELGGAFLVKGVEAHTALRSWLVCSRQFGPVGVGAYSACKG